LEGVEDRLPEGLSGLDAEKAHSTSLMMVVTNVLGNEGALGSHTPKMAQTKTGWYSSGMTWMDSQTQWVVAVRMPMCQDGNSVVRGVPCQVDSVQVDHHALGL